MSAKDWAQCPQCLAREQASKLSKLNQLANSYGKISASSYESLFRQANAPIHRTEHMRVDYEIGVCDKGEFSCWFGVSCEDCGYEFKFEHKQQTEIDATA